MRFENTFPTDIEIKYQARNINYGQDPIPITASIPAEESKDIISQQIKASSSTTHDCEDGYSIIEVEISNESLSQYTFCESGALYDNSLKIRILEISANCSDDEAQITSGF
ncbi:hypothetical protein [Kaarinaea lacus]